MPAELLWRDAAPLFSEPTGQGWTQIGELAIALVLSSLIGLERQLRQKSAGLRTHTLVGLGAALFLLVSKYGFTDVLVTGRVVLDPSRVAAQIVTGIGFIGGGLIFVRKDAVRGLTTAAVVWVTAAVGAASAAGLPVLAAVVTAAHFLVVYGYPPLMRAISHNRSASTVLRLRYHDGQGALRGILSTATGAGFSVAEVHTQRSTRAPDAGMDGEDHEVDTLAKGEISLRLMVVGAASTTELASTLSEVDGVLSVDLGRDEFDEDRAE
ncbi:MAG: MgtC/SapB family protein [Sciscionella sp.]